MTEHDVAFAGERGDRPLAVPSDDAIELFAFCDRRAMPDRPPTGEPFGTGTLLHRVGPIAALVAVVPMAEYCGADAEGHLADLAWIAPRIGRHAALVEWARQWSAVYPAPFGAIYSGLASLSAFVRAHERTISEFLRSVAGQEEWEFRASLRLDGPATLDALARRAWPEVSGLPKGVRYLRICRDREALLEFGRDEVAAFARAAMGRLPVSAIAQRGRSSGEVLDSPAAEITARYALLVPRADVGAMQETVRDLAGAGSAGVAVSLSGPWAPYSFRPDLRAPG
jgi:hypothetical protein